MKYFLNYKRESLRIVYYHVISDIKYPYYFDEKSITPDEFEDQIKFFKKHYEIITLSEAQQLSLNNKSLKHKLVITFDDGFKDNYYVIRPILNKLNCKATFFLIGNCIDNKDLMWRNKLIEINKVRKNRLHLALQNMADEYNLNLKGSEDLMKWSADELLMERKDEMVDFLWSETMNISVQEYLSLHEPYLTSGQIKELCEQGFEFGSHTMSHPFCNNLSFEKFKYEVINCKDVIENITKEKISSFSYPYGIRASEEFENMLLQDKDCSIKTFLTTRNKLRNTNENIGLWGRDNMEFNTKIAMSRFFLISSLRNIFN